MTVMCCAAGTVDGAVYTPDELMDPTKGLIDHVTPEFAGFVVAVNVTVWLAFSEGLAGDIETVTGLSVQLPIWG